LSDRVFDRIPLALEVEYRTAGAFLVAYTANLSKGGLFIETERPLAAGTDLMLRFSIPDHGPIEVRGLVAWIRPAAVDGKPAGMGVEFEHLDARHGEIIDGIVGGFRGLRILLVSSTVQARTQLARFVRSILSTAEVLEAASADAAEAQLAQEPDLMILDLDENVKGEGLYALRLAKTGAQNVPVIATSRDETARHRALELGADDVLATPFLMPDLQASILRALGRPLRVG
jgi:type IV pilus assembly protein PilZ